MKTVFSERHWEDLPKKDDDCSTANGDKLAVFSSLSPLPEGEGTKVWALLKKDNFTSFQVYQETLRRRDGGEGKKIAFDAVAEYIYVKVRYNHEDG